MFNEIFGITCLVSGADMVPRPSRFDYSVGY